MSLFLKNYTSAVSVDQTLAKIEKTLVRCGVSGIAKEYDGRGKINALAFVIRFTANGANQELNIRLPVDADKAQEALWRDYADGDKTTVDGTILYNSRKRLNRASFKEQAERTAWKIMQDWIEVQMSMIQMQQAEVTQVFLPYIWRGGQSFYDEIRGNGYKTLLPPAA